MTSAICIACVISELSKTTVVRIYDQGHFFRLRQRDVGDETASDHVCRHLDVRGDAVVTESVCRGSTARLRLQLPETEKMLSDLALSLRQDGE